MCISRNPVTNTFICIVCIRNEKKRYCIRMFQKLFGDVRK